MMRGRSGTIIHWMHAYARDSALILCLALLTGCECRARGVRDAAPGGDGGPDAARDAGPCADECPTLGEVWCYGDSAEAQCLPGPEGCRVVEVTPCEPDVCVETATGATCTESIFPVCGDSVCWNDSFENCASCPFDCDACGLCGNGYCEAGEDCPADCGVCPQCCGDGVCAAGESCSDCPLDCGSCTGACGDGLCDAPTGEDCATCMADCGPCTDCGNGLCQAGETCATCAFDCGACPPVCGNGFCELGETCGSCASDCPICGAECGNGVCDPGENVCNCPADACPIC